MKRYRVLNFEFDTRPGLLKLGIPAGWDEKVKPQHRKNLEEIQKSYLEEFGNDNIDKKLANIKDIGKKPISIIAFHNNFYNQVFNAFVIGSYYPALTGACALGERILNHLILVLREDFKSTPEYKNIYKKDSFDDWNLAINTLESWGILLPNVVKTFMDLSELRHRSIHFNPAVDRNDRQLALKAIGYLNEIIQNQFGAFGNLPWFIVGIRGASYIRKSIENNPFIKRIYLPNCVLVGYKHTLENSPNGFIVKDDYKYDSAEISDEQFFELVNSR